MKKIHFDNVGGNKLWLVLAIVSLILIIVGLLKPYDMQNPRFYAGISALGFLIIAVLLSRPFWYKNVVQWNKKGMTIRINRWQGEQLKFANVQHVDLDGKMLHVTRKTGADLKLNLEEFSTEDTERLRSIIEHG